MPTPEAAIVICGAVVGCPTGEIANEADPPAVLLNDIESMAVTDMPVGTPTVTWVPALPVSVTSAAQ